MELDPDEDGVELDPDEDGVELDDAAAAAAAGTLLLRSDQLFFSCLTHSIKSRRTF